MMSSSVLGASLEDWLKAWKLWANTRKRGRMAQFIVNKLEERKQARWMDITIGKFELTEWHQIAEEWFKEKSRNSDPVDAPCMLRKGLPRAFPGLEEVKSESIKEGTQYRSRVFQTTPQLLQEVQLYVNKPSGGYGQSQVYNGDMCYGPQPVINGAYAPVTSHYPLPPSSHAGVPPQMSYAPVKVEPDVVYRPGGVAGGSPASSDAASPYYDYHNGSGHVTSPPTGYSMDNTLQDMSITTNGPQMSPYDGGGSVSPYTLESPQYQQPSASAAASGMLTVPNDVDTWSNNSSQHNSPNQRFSPDPGYLPDNMTQSLSPISMATPMQQELLAVKPYPDRSLLEGGGKLALLFSGPLPAGPKWLSFISQQRAEYVHQVEALQENVQALSAIIPKHDIPETLMLQVVCGGQVVAQTEFTYYANAQYHSDLLFQYLTQSFPGYFPQIDPGPLGGDIGGDAGGGGGAGYMYGGHNIPPTSYSLLLGACCLGIEPLVLATLQLNSMQAISVKQLQRAVEVCEEHSHENLVSVLKSIVALAEVVAKGDGQGGRGILQEEAKEALSKLDNGGDPKDGSARVLARLVQIKKMEERAKLEEERETGVSPSSGSPVHSDPHPLPRRLSSRLQRQDESVRDDDDEEEVEEEEEEGGSGSEGEGERGGSGRGPSVSEQDDEIGPLRPKLSTSVRSRSAGGGGGGGAGSRRMLAATYSDAADSAVSMSFDRDELARRASASLTGYSLNMGTEGAVNVNIDPEQGYTFSNALQYECVFLVSEDFPPGSDNTVIKCGDRIVQIGDTPLRDKGPDDFHELLQTEAPRGTTVKILPRLSPPPSASVTSSAGYCSLGEGDRRPLLRKHSDQQLISSLTMKVSNLLSMRASGAKRSVTIPYVAGEGFGFKMIGGNAVGLFVSEVRVSRRELQPGDQILEINGESTRNMTHFEASQLLGKDKLSLVVTENTAKFQTIRDHFEHESYYVRCHVDHSSSDAKDMRLEQGDVVRVVNTTLFPSWWLAWRVDENTGVDLELRRIPSPVKAKQQYGKDVYEKVPTAESAEQRPLLVA